MKSAGLEGLASGTDGADRRDIQLCYDGSQECHGEKLRALYDGCGRKSTEREREGELIGDRSSRTRR